MIGKMGLERLEGARVTVVGIGAVGSFAVEALARSLARAAAPMLPYMSRAQTYAVLVESHAAPPRLAGDAAGSTHRAIVPLHQPQVDFGLTDRCGAFGS